MAYEFLGI